MWRTGLLGISLGVFLAAALQSLRFLLLPALALLLLGLDGGESSSSEVLLKGKPVGVEWSDGDTLTFTTGPRKGRRARLVGFNTLESYGPVHRWGSWQPAGLLQIALESRDIASSRSWECSLRKGKDSYGRFLLDCPEARRSMLRSGHAHVFAYDSEADPADLALQREARAEGRGMWAQGRPETLVTNVRADPEGRVFLRVVSCRTGSTRAEHQREDYSICEEICHGPEVSGSCMLFVPWTRRYEDRPSCLDP